MEIKIYHFARSQGKGTIVYSVGNSPMIEKNFPVEWTDNKVLESIGVESPKPKEEPKPIEQQKQESEEQQKQEEKKVPVNQQMESKRELKKKYIADLLKIGIDKSKEPSFARIEAAWKKHYQK